MTLRKEIQLAQHELKHTLNSTDAEKEKLKAEYVAAFDLQKQEIAKL